MAFLVKRVLNFKEALVLCLVLVVLFRSNVISADKLVFAVIMHGIDGKVKTGTYLGPAILIHLRH
jgi:hypothetical protein